MILFGHPRPASHADAAIEHLDFGRTDPVFRQLLADWNELAAGAPIFVSPGFIELQMPLAPPGERVVATSASAAGSPPSSRWFATARRWPR